MLTVFTMQTARVDATGITEKSGYNPEMAQVGDLLLDLRETCTNNPGAILRGPMLGHKAEKCPTPSATMVSGLTGSFQTFAQAQSLHNAFGTIGPLDTVEPAHYIQWFLDNCEYARVGRVNEFGIHHYDQRAVDMVAPEQMEL